MKDLPAISYSNELLPIGSVLLVKELNQLVMMYGRK